MREALLLHREGGSPLPVQGPVWVPLAGHRPRTVPSQNHSPLSRCRRPRPRTQRSCPSCPPSSSPWLVGGQVLDSCLGWGGGVAVGHRFPSRTTAAQSRHLQAHAHGQPDRVCECEPDGACFCAPDLAAGMRSLAMWYTLSRYNSGVAITRALSECCQQSSDCCLLSPAVQSADWLLCDC